MFHESKYLYQNFHKLHHQWVDTYAVTATAAHPFEHFVSNLPTVLGPAFVLNLPYVISSIFVIIATFHTCIQHSGYRIIIKINFDFIKFSKRFYSNNIKKLLDNIYNSEDDDDDDDDDDNDSDSDRDNQSNHDDSEEKKENSKAISSKEEEEELIDEFNSMYDFHHDFHHHYQTAEYGIGGLCDLFFKTRMKDQFPKAWKKIVSNAYNNGYILNGVTNDDLIEILKDRRKKKESKFTANDCGDEKKTDSDDNGNDNDNDNGNDDYGNKSKDGCEKKNGSSKDKLLNGKNDVTTPRKRKRRKKR